MCKLLPLCAGRIFFVTCTNTSNFFSSKSNTGWKNNFTVKEDRCKIFLSILKGEHTGMDQRRFQSGTNHFVQYEGGTPFFCAKRYKKASIPSVCKYWFIPQQATSADIRISNTELTNPCVIFFGMHSMAIVHSPRVKSTLPQLYKSLILHN